MAVFTINHFIFFLASLLSGSIVFNDVAACPERCVCFRTTVQCMFLQLHRVISVPPDTTILDLRSNKIKSIPPGSFAGLNQLNTLLLNHNEIGYLSRDAFSGLPELRHLYLYKNQIETIDNGTFNQLDKLEQLYLHNNFIKHLPDGVFSNLAKLRKLRLDNNPLVCDCNLLWLSEKLKEINEQTQTIAKCGHPISLEGLSVAALLPNQFRCREPKFTVQPENAQYIIGRTVFFRCSAVGDPDPEIVWLHDHEVVHQSSRHVVLDDGSLMIQNLRSEDRGSYSCLARSAAGQTESNEALLEPNVVPSIAQPQFDRAQSQSFSRESSGDQNIEGFSPRRSDITTVRGETIQLACSASRGTNQAVSWTKDGLTLASHARFTLLTSGGLLIVNIQQEDEGVYKCTVREGTNVYTSESRITVQVPPSFSESPEDQTVVEGTTISFRCVSVGNPVPVITWSKENEPLPNNGRFEIIENAQVLRIIRVRFSDRGLYICRGENTAGRRETTAELAVTPRVPPSITRRQGDINVSIGSRVSLMCDARGDPAPEYRWIRNRRPIQYSHRVQSVGNQLVIQRAQFSDAGRYECVAENIEGIDRSSFVLNVLSDSRTYAGNAFINVSAAEAINRINLAANETYRDLFNTRRTHSIQDLLTIVRYPTSDALELAKAEEIFEQTLEIISRHVKDGHRYNLEGHEENYRELLSPEHLHQIAYLSGCGKEMPLTDCSDMCFHKKYRAIDGSCNNLQEPTKGAANRAFKRLLEPRYENGFNTPVGWNPSKVYNGVHLPSARLISSLMIGSQHVTDDDNSTHMLMQWGQFVDHDLDLSPQAISYTRFSDGRRCNETCENKLPCFPIQVPQSDQRIRNKTCLGFARSSATCNTGQTSIFYNTLSPRQQLNAITAFIDASNVYASNVTEALSLRDTTTNRGLLRVGARPDGKALLPFDNEGLLKHVDCQIEATKRHLPCFLAGDHRVNEQLALTAMHTLWLRQHNRVATELLQLNPQWDGTMLYHETRKIIGAMMQHITYSHFLKHFLGPSGMEALGEYKGYDPQVDPTISNEFATAAFRVGHTLVQPVIYRLNESFEPIRHGNLPLHKAFFSPYRLVEEGGIDPLIRGLFGVAGKKQMPKEMVNIELTEKLFSLANSIGQDLAALNIQRGRDHGLPGYNEYRKYCGLTKVTNFEELSNEITESDIRSHLQALYSHPDNIDLFVGGISETPLPGSKVGPTFQCLIVDQFKRTRAGDRFWYENPGVFTADQLTQLKQVTLARVICDNGDNIDRIQKDVFINTKRKDYVSCDDIPKIDLKMWADCCHDCDKSGNFESITSHYRSRRSTHSYPEDRPVQGSFRSGPSDIQSDAPVTDSKPRKVLTDHQMDEFNARIDGMENVMKKFDKMLNRLQKQVTTLQRQILKDSLNCSGDNGTLHLNNEKWKVNACKTCSCLNGQVECQTDICPEPACKNPKRVEGICCPVC